MVVLVAWAYAVAMALRAANIVWSTAMAYYRNVPQTRCTYSVDCASTRSAFLVPVYWVLTSYVVWFQRCGASLGFVVTLLWNLRRDAWAYPDMETLTFLLT